MSFDQRGSLVPAGLTLPQVRRLVRDAEEESRARSCTARIVQGMAFRYECSEEAGHHGPHTAVVEATRHGTSAPFLITRIQWSDEEPGRPVE